MPHPQAAFAGVRYEDLAFKPHPFLGATEENLGMMQRLRRALPGDFPAHLLDRRVEAATVSFPNGWALSILRNMKGIHPWNDFETCRFPEGSPVSHATVEEVQREIDEVAAL